MFLAMANGTITYLKNNIMTLEEIFTLENMNNAFYVGCKISHWKDTTQRYESNLLLNNIQLRDEILSGEYKMSPTTNFILNERGKARKIEAPSQRDRVVQKVLCNKILVPQLTKWLIYDNYASLKNRGTSFARKRIDVLLRRYINKCGNDGYVLQIDIKKYFESIDHQILKELVHSRIKEPKEVMDLIDYIIDNSSKTDKGLNLGSEAPQILAIFYLSNVDNYIKSVKGIKYYGRYMDDMIIFSNSKEELKGLLKDIKYQLSLLKLEVNDRKTQIIKLSHGFVYMQIKYKIDGNKIIKCSTSKKIVRERRRLKKFKKQYELGNMSELEIHNCYKSWRQGMIKDCNHCYKSIDRLDRLYKELFPKSEQFVKLSRNELIDETFRKENLYDLFSTY